MPELEETTAEATAEFFLSNFGPSALLEASVCGHQALAENNLEKCQFWRIVLDHIEASARPSSR
jgi:hypothetical protein